MDPSMENGFLFELAQAQMAREIFPDCPLKYMPPTKFMSGNIFKGYAINTMFNFISKATDQKIHLLGMLTEAIHNPFIQDRELAVENALYIMNNMAAFYDEIEFKKEGIIAQRAFKVLEQTIEFLEKVKELGLFDAIEQGLFAEVKRKKEGGKGLAGVIKRADGYWNPFEDFLKKQLGLD
jgi:beta-lysine 5,6-aminomutase alpha subunit